MPPLMLKRQVEVDVACSVKQVCDLGNNLENVPRWLPLIKNVQPVPGQADRWRWQFGLRFSLLVEWVSHIEQRLPVMIPATRPPQSSTKRTYAINRRVPT